MEAGVSNKEEENKEIRSRGYLKKVGVSVCVSVMRVETVATFRRSRQTYLCKVCFTKGGSCWYLSTELQLYCDCGRASSSQTGLLERLPSETGQVSEVPTLGEKRSHAAPAKDSFDSM